MNKYITIILLSVQGDEPKWKLLQHASNPAISNPPISPVAKKFEQLASTETFLKVSKFDLGLFGKPNGV